MPRSRPRPAWLPPIWVFVAGAVVLVLVTVGGYVAGTQWNTAAESAEADDTAAQTVNSPEEDSDEEDESAEEDGDADGDEDEDEEEEDEEDYPAGIDPEAFYVLENVKEGIAADVAGAATHNNAPVIAFDRHDEGNQQFHFVHVTENYFEIVSRVSGKSLQVGGGQDLDENEIAQLTSTGDARQHWAVIEGEGGTVRFVNRATGQALQTSGGGNPLKQAENKNDKEEQRWRLVPVG